MFILFNAKRQWKKYAASLFVAIIFCWFYLQGPFNKLVESTNLIVNESKFLTPIFIQDQQRVQQKKFGLVSEEQAKIAGVSFYKLVGRKKAVKTYGLIADQHHKPSMKAEVGEEIQKHATLLNADLTTELKNALDMFYVELRDKDERLAGLYLETTGLTEHIKGYAGFITLGITVSSQGKINAVHHIGSQETSSYLRQIDDAGFYQQFSGIDLNGDNHQIDAVSGATISTQAMAKTLTALLNIATESPLSLYLDNDPAGTRVEANLSNEWIIQIILIALVFSYFWQPWLMRTRRRTTVVMLLSAVYIGFYLNNSFTYISLLHPFLGVSVSLLVGFYCAFVLLGAIWDNNTYCKFVCPYGNVQRLMTRMFPAFRRSFFVSSRWVKRARTLLTLVIIAGVIAGQNHWASYELFPDLFGLEIHTFWFAISLIVILLSIVYPMIWCRLLCPTGEVLDWFSNFVSRPSRKRPSKDNLSNCKQCANGKCNAIKVKKT